MVVFLLCCRIVLLGVLVGVSACGSRPALHLHVATSLAGLVEAWLDDAPAGFTLPVLLHRGASSTLARQIRAGAPADVFLSADPRLLSELASIEQRVLLRNHLVLVTPPTSKLASLEAATSLVLGAPGVPLGEYARELLAERGLAEPARVVHGKDAHDVLAKLRAGAAEAALVYATDLSLAPELRVAARYTADTDPDVRYQAALLTEAGRELFEALCAEAFAKHAHAAGFAPGAAH